MKKLFTMLLFLGGIILPTLAQTRQFRQEERHGNPGKWFTMNLDSKRFYFGEKEEGTNYLLIKDYKQEGELETFALYLANTPNFKAYDVELVMESETKQYLKATPVGKEQYPEVVYDIKVMTLDNVKEYKRAKDAEIRRNDRERERQMAADKLKRKVNKKNDHSSSKQSEPKDLKKEIKKGVEKEAKKAIKKLFKGF